MCMSDSVMLCFVQGLDGKDKDGKDKEAKFQLVKNKLLRKSRWESVDFLHFEGDVALGNALGLKKEARRK